jgi:glucose-1-phosphate adenylyltransferase
MGVIMSELTALILGGGRGSRLQPLTDFRAKPAVPIAGKFRLIDIPISNCIHAGVKRIFIITQFNTESLHRHIHNTYRFDNFTRGYIRILAAQQTADSQDWYQGTADAVRKNLQFIEGADDHIIILSGDHLYRMDYREFFNYHLERDADISIAVKPVFQEETTHFGILKANRRGRITDFFEKPQDQVLLNDLRVDPILFQNFEIEPNNRTHIASMGIYIFKKEILFEVLNKNTMEDFGKEVIPSSLKKSNVYAYFFDSYWEDIGNIGSFFNAHMNLTQSIPDFNFYDEEYLFYTRPRYLPSTKIINCHVNHSMIAEGAILLGSSIENTTIGIRSFIDYGTHIERSIIMGNTRYETIEERRMNSEKGLPNLGIGPNCVIKNAIIDLNVSIGNDAQLINQNQITESFQANYAIRDGIIIVPKSATIAAHTII